MSSVSDPVPVGRAQAMLGEGPCWDSESGCLHWVDIHGRALHRYRLSDGKEWRWDVGGDPGCIVLAEDGAPVVAMEDEVLRFRAWGASAEPVVLASVPRGEPGRLRFNDGKCDPRGRLWVGTMDRKESKPLGCLYRIGGGGNASPMQRGVTISNGLGWSPAGDEMYYIDSPCRKVWAYEFDLVSGDLGERRTVVEFGSEDGFPDGMCVDAEGALCVAFWGGGCVRRIDPANGEILTKIELPVSQVTSCAFGGGGFRTLFITTASVGTDPEIEPLAGRLFVTEPGFMGLPSVRMS